IVLLKMKGTVESHSGYSIDDDAVTVPAYFNNTLSTNPCALRMSPHGPLATVLSPPSSPQLATHSLSIDNDPHLQYPLSGTVVRPPLVLSVS
ncbi:hypothetical protein K503DRAFT_777171, partial [Rhizopogon vinicolor AM-OR11-026]